jgi:glycerol dehydrogenase-like iron-containing ADH family enzyme
MATVKTPEFYIRGPEVLKRAGELIAPFGKKALIIGGKTALRVVAGDFYPSLILYGIQYEVHELTGYPTQEAIDELAAHAAQTGIEVVIGIGGGRALDLAKGVGEATGVPVVTVPTIAATCAAWAALCAIYDEEGRFRFYSYPKSSPKLVLADTGILAAAPVRYLKAGIADTLAKWHEAAPNLKSSNNDLYLRLGIKTAELILDILHTEGPKALKEAQEGQAGQAFQDVVDAIILLAGLVGSVKGDKSFGGFAHPFYNSVTQIPETRSLLHGEKVIFGLLVQFVLEQRQEQEISAQVLWSRKLALPVTLKQLGIEKNLPEKVAAIAAEIMENLSFYQALDHEVTREEIVSAILQADKIGGNQAGEAEEIIDKCG